MTWNHAYQYTTANNKAITYNLLKMDSGWRLEAYLPKRVSPTDRIKVLQWFDSYASQVRSQHPRWNTRFRAADQAYFLDIHKLDTPNEVLKATRSLESEMWTQLTLDYAR